MNSNYKDRIIKYLEETLGFSVQLKKLPDIQLKELPIYLKYSNFYYDLMLDGHKLILIYSKDNIPKTALQLKNQSQIIARVMGKKVIFGMDKQSPLLRKRLIQEKVNFIIPCYRLYLPGLLTDIKEKMAQPQIFPKLLSPSAQFFLLYHLLVEYLESYAFKEIAQKLGYTPKTVTKIASELKEKDICKVVGTKEKRFVFDVNRKQLWKIVEPQMQSPIYKIFYSNQKKEMRYCKSGNSALYHYYPLRRPEKTTYAIYRPEFEEIKEKNYRNYLDEVEGEIQIEVWKYNPALLNNNRYVDLLSLYLCYRENSDERIKAELREMIQKRTW
ncbi:MAG: hypothetical protein LBP83_06195 [Dysgonamonadaceae bacterium]|nr:hypothetical protein [Dysgonamonadaceae bacterium]